MRLEIGPITDPRLRSDVGVPAAVSCYGFPALDQRDRTRGTWFLEGSGRRHSAALLFTELTWVSTMRENLMTEMWAGAGRPVLSAAAKLQAEISTSTAG